VFPPQVFHAIHVYAKDFYQGIVIVCALGKDGDQLAQLVCPVFLNNKGDQAVAFSIRQNGPIPLVWK
jgi:hypothetical protein